MAFCMMRSLGTPPVADWKVREVVELTVSAPVSDFQDLERPDFRGQGARYSRAIREPTGACGGAVGG